MWKSFLLRKTFPAVENRDVFHRDFRPFSTGCGKPQSKSAAGGKTVLHTTDSPYCYYYCFPLFFSVLFFVGARCGGCVKPPAQKRRQGRIVSVVSVCRFRISGYAGTQGGRPSEKTGSFPRCFRSFFLPAGKRRTPKSRPPIRPTDRKPRAFPPRPFPPDCPEDEETDTENRPCAGASVRQSLPPAQAHLVFLTPSVLRFPFRNRAADAKNHTSTHSNTINPKGRNKCTLSFRKKCCWTI